MVGKHTSPTSKASTGSHQKRHLTASTRQATTSTPPSATTTFIVRNLACAQHVLYLQLLSEVVGHYGSKGAEQWSQEDADITDVNGDVKKV